MTDQEPEDFDGFRQLPVEIIVHIFNMFSYSEISSLRQVSRKFDVIGKSLLNTGFISLGDRLDKAMVSVKKMLPKRESQRRSHSLSKVNEVYSALETRYALLSMTFRKHIDDNTCCFIAGKVLDEAFKVLSILDGCVKRREQPHETQEMLKDIRDYSSMAMEYFDEEIAPGIRIYDPLNMIARSRCRHFGALAKTINTSALNLRVSQTPFSTSIFETPKFMDWKRQVDEKLRNQDHRIAEQDRIIGEQSRAINCIIECVNQVSSDLSFNFVKDLKSLNDQAGVGSLKNIEISINSEKQQSSSGMAQQNERKRRVDDSAECTSAKRQPIDDE